ncbi:GPALPP motifs-containing protein 1 isoform X1 [Colossoma macropomum]|uniref:GPALPP motifs-containing protein 1 isoform X1 n=1 Tax=Colossoma macropomum TaxID=42526 RepID=UPI001865005B|nr:GPALPP motifs-containing protein 1 isoform X1 [Colossoma macropomum]
MSGSNVIGPALPPGLRENRSDESDEEDRIIGPALPPLYKPVESTSSSEDSDQEVVFKRAKYSGSGDGPSPNRSRREEQAARKPSVEDDDGFFGPALPPGYKKKESSPERPPVLGPALPPGFERQDHDEDAEEDDGAIGPALPPGYTADSSSSEGEDDAVVGPMPAKDAAESSVALDFERRAKRMKDKLMGLDNEPEELKRESWMTELPPELQHIGLGARTFKKRSGPEDKDRSIWTDTPADRERKARERQEAKEKGLPAKEEGPRLSQKDLDMAEKVSKYNESKRGESLLSMHTKKMKRKAEEDSKQPVERRPFDRDADLQVNRFDEAQKKALLKKSQELNTRFSHSKDRMFL